MELHPGERHPGERHPGEEVGAAPGGLAARIAIGAVLAAALIIGVRVGPWLLLVVVVAATAAGAIELGTSFGEQRLTTSPLLYLAGAAAFPVAAYLWKEPGLTGAAAAVIVIAAFRFVLARPERGALLSIAAFVLASLYLGFGGSYVMLLARRPHASAVVEGFVLIVALYYAGRLPADHLAGRTLAPHLKGAPSLPGALVGALGCIVGAIGLLSLAGDHVTIVPILQIGVSTGAACTLGAVAWALIRPEAAPVERSALPGQILGIVSGGVMVAPALFYALRLAAR